MKQYEYQIAFFDRLELRTGGPAFQALNELGAAGWHVVHVRDDPQHSHNLTFLMERDKAT